MNFYRVKEPPVVSETIILGWDHPLAVGQPPARKPCAACGHMFVGGDAIVLVPLGPGDDQEERERCRRGGYFNAVCAVTHAACAGVAP